MIDVIMKKIPVVFLLSITLSAGLTGCGGNGSSRTSATQLTAINHNQRGIKAESRGDLELALAEFTESLRINSTVENTDGMVVALVNIARVNRYKGETDAAREAINKAVPMVATVSPLFSETAFEKSMVSLQSGDFSEAEEFATKSLAAEKGGKRGSGLNLLARILYLQGHFTEARVKAEEALAHNGKMGLQEEEANSLRLLGGIFTATKRPAEALEAFNRALEMDKALGKSRKIATDLRELALLHLSMNEPVKTISFYQRAFTVSLNDGDLGASARDLEKMAQLYEKLGEKQKAERLLAERDALLAKSKKR